MRDRITLVIETPRVCTYTCMHTHTHTHTQERGSNGDHLFPRKSGIQLPGVKSKPATTPARKRKRRSQNSDADNQLFLEAQRDLSVRGQGISTFCYDYSVHCLKKKTPKGCHEEFLNLSLTA